MSCTQINRRASWSLLFLYLSSSFSSLIWFCSSCFASYISALNHPSCTWADFYIHFVLPQALICPAIILVLVSSEESPPMCNMSSGRRFSLASHLKPSITARVFFAPLKMRCLHFPSNRSYAYSLVLLIVLWSAWPEDSMCFVRFPLLSLSPPPVPDAASSLPLLGAAESHTAQLLACCCWAGKDPSAGTSVGKKCRG